MFFRPENSLISTRIYRNENKIRTFVVNRPKYSKHENSESTNYNIGNDVDLKLYRISKVAFHNLNYLTLIFFGHLRVEVGFTTRCVVSFYGMRILVMLRLVVSVLPYVKPVYGLSGMQPHG